MRVDNSLPQKRVYEFGNFRLNAQERVIESAGRPLSIAPKALDLLIVLVENRGRLVEKEDLMRRVWPGTLDGELSATRTDKNVVCVDDPISSVTQLFVCLFIFGRL